MTTPDFGFVADGVRRIRPFWKDSLFHHEVLAGAVTDSPRAAVPRLIARTQRRAAASGGLRKCEGGRTREMKTEAQRNGGDQRHVEFTITLLGCAVIKERSPQRARRLQACPVRSLAPLISRVSPTETQRRNLQEGLFFLQPHHHHHRQHQPLHRICRASTDCQERARSDANEPLLKKVFPSLFFFFDDLMKISCISESASLPMNLSTSEIRYKENFW